MDISKKPLNSADFLRIEQELNSLMISEKDQAEASYQYLHELIRLADFTDAEQTKAEIYEGIIRYQMGQQDHQLVKNLLQDAQDYAIEHNLAQSLERIHNVRAISFAKEGHYYSAIEIWEKLIKHDTNPMFKTKILNNLVIGYGYTSQFTRAIDVAYEMIGLMEQNGQTDSFHTAYVTLGNAYRQARQFDKARESYEKGLEFAIGIDDKQVIYMAKNNLSLTLSDLGRYEEALAIAFESLDLRKKYFNESNLISSYNNIGIIYQKLNDHQQALEYIEKGLKLYHEGFSEDSKGMCLVSMARSYLALGKLDKAMDMIQQSSQIAAQLGLSSLNLEICEVSRELRKQQGDTDAALRLAEEQIDLLTCRISELTNNMVSKSEADYLRRQIEETSESVRLQNEELKASNLVIKEKSAELTQTNESLKDTVDMLNTLIRVISHDVRGPVATSALILRMMQDGEFSPEEKDSFLNDMAESMDETADLLTQMLFWMEANKHSTGISHMKRHIDLAGIVNSVVKMYSTQMRQKKIKLIYKPWEGSLVLLSEPNALKTVFRNILSNAVKFTGEGGEINIQISESEFWVEVCITDDGIGMSEEELEKLRSQSIVSQQGTMREFGMGMGLKLSFNCISMLGAELKVESRKGYGSSFTIRMTKEL